MPFGAREDEGWRLCFRRGATVFFFHEKTLPDYPIEFPTQRAAKMCADELNEMWDEYYPNQKKEKPPTRDVFERMVKIIAFHNGISQQDAKEILDATE